MRYKANRRSWNDEQLVKAVAESDSYNQVIVKLGLKVTAAGNKATIKKYIAQLGLDTSHFHGQGWVGKRDFHPARRTLEEILVKGSTYTTSNLNKRLRKEGILDNFCSSCSLNEWCGQPLTLELDHINGDSTDHRLENLRLLCPNCHSLTPTWRGRKNRRVASLVYAVRQGPEEPWNQFRTLGEALGDRELYTCDPHDMCCMSTETVTRSMPGAVAGSYFLPKETKYLSVDLISGMLQ